MKNSIRFILAITFVLTGFTATRSLAQCTIDSTQTAPGVYPDSIPPGTVFDFYTQDITFVMLTDTAGYTITNFEIANITGLPFGINWICNNSANGCNYDPNINLYGCINLSGTPLIPGTYSLNVTVIATVTIFGAVNINYPVQLIVLPDTVSNGGFSMTNSTGCAPLTVGFTNNLPGQASYLWDFGNTVSDTSENPSAQTYTIPGNYTVTQTVIPNVPPQYFLSEVTVNSVPDNYNEIFLGQSLDPDPDLYFVLSDTSGNSIYDSRPATNNTQPPYTWTVPNIQLNNEMYSLHFFDQDSLLVSLGDDDLGTIYFSGWGLSGSGTDSLPGINGILDANYSILNVPVLPVVSTDTVHVFPSPPTPSITASGPVTFCDGDSVTLSSSATVGNQWFESAAGILPGDTNQTLLVTVQGGYHVVITSSNGCTSSSPDTIVLVNSLPPKPTLFAIGDTIFCALTGYNLQWYLNGSAIAGATGQNYVPLVAGTYSVVATDPNGCSTGSDPLLVIGVGVMEDNEISGLSINPNPTSGIVNIRFISLKADDFSIVISDLTGRIVFNQELNQDGGNVQTTIDLTGQPVGVYILELKGRDFSTKKKLILK